MIKAVLFDLDGTIIDTNELIIQSFQHAHRTHFSKELSRDEICRCFGEPLMKTLKRYDEENADLLREYFQKFNEENHDRMTYAYEGARETFVALKQRGIKVGIVTSKRMKMALKGIELAKLNSLLDVLLTPEKTEKHKPHPEPLLTACSLLGLEPKEALYVGDTFVDLECSKAAGMNSCLVTYTVLPMEELMKLEPDFTVDKLIDIVDLVDRINRAE